MHQNNSRHLRHASASSPRWTPHHVPPDADPLRLVPLVAHPAGAGGYFQQLAARVCVPEDARAGREVDVCDEETFGGEDRVDPGGFMGGFMGG